jgi:hypothetical protein
MKDEKEKDEREEIERKMKEKEKERDLELGLVSESQQGKQSLRDGEERVVGAAESVKSLDFDDAPWSLQQGPHA